MEEPQKTPNESLINKQGKVSKEGETKREDRYIQFPLCLLQSTYENPEKGLNLIFGFGLVHYSKKLNYKIEEVARQLMYYFYNPSSKIQGNLFRLLKKYITNEDLIIDEDHRGFEQGVFMKNNDEVEQLIELFESNSKFKQAAIIMYQIHQAAESLKMHVYRIEDLLKDFEEGSKFLNQFELKFEKDSWTSVKPTQLIKFRDSLQNIDKFRAYLGVKSMIGKKDYISTNKPAILSRMIGCKSKKAFEYYSKDKNLISAVEKYSKRYQMDKLLLELAKSKFIMYLSKPKVSVIYVSRHMEPEKLGELIRKSKAKNDLKSRIKAVSKSLCNNKMSTREEQEEQQEDNIFNNTI